MPLEKGIDAAAVDYGRLLRSALALLDARAKVAEACDEATRLVRESNTHLSQAYATMARVFEVGTDRYFIVDGKLVHVVHTRNGQFSVGVTTYTTPEPV